MVKRAFLLCLTIVFVIGVILLYEGLTLLKVGDEAPDVTAVTNTGETIRLRDYRGRSNVVLYFYPQDFTAGCTEQACSLRDHYEEIKEYDAVIFGVSTDKPDIHEKFVSAYHLPFPLISDGDRSISKSYRALWLFGLWPYAKRVTYVIDKQGFIRMVSHHEMHIGRHLDDILEALRHSPRTQ